jgi:hypothetical protein
MAGPNVIAAYFGGTGRNQILSQTLASTTETEFKLGNDTAVTTNIAVLSMPTQTAIQGSLTPSDTSMNPAVLNSGFSRSGYTFDQNPPFNSGSFDNAKPFLVRLAGVVTPASNAANTLTIILYLGTSKSGTAICTTGALTGMETSTEAGGFIMETQLIWDSTSGEGHGQFWYLLNGATPNYHVWAVNSAEFAAAAVANLQFCASATWGNAVGGVIAISEFSVSQL